MPRDARLATRQRRPESNAYLFRPGNRVELLAAEHAPADLAGSRLFAGASLTLPRQFT
jgi:hypothetical protein